MKLKKRGLKIIGFGKFGTIYEGIKGKQAAQFLLVEKAGEVHEALYHHKIGPIDIVWGNKEYGLMKIIEKHPEVVSQMQEILDCSMIISHTKNRIKLESKDHKSIIRLDWDGEQKTWLLTMYEKKTTK